MTFVVGFVVWIAIGLVAGLAVTRLYKAAGTGPVLTLIFGVCGAFIGGMLGESAHVFHNAHPLRVGGLIGAVTGSIFFAYLYHLVARKVV